MTNKQLLKRLQYQQNRLLDIKGYSFYLSYNYSIDIDKYFTIYIHDFSKNHDIIYHENLSKTDALLGIKLSKLKDFIDGLLNNEKTRN